MIFFDAYACHSPTGHPPSPLLLAASVGAWLSWLIMLRVASSSRRGRSIPKRRLAQFALRPKKAALSLSLSLSNTPKFSRMSAPMPRGIPHFPNPLPPHASPTLWRVQWLLQRTKQPSLALLHFTILLLLLLLLLFTRTQTTLLCAFWRVKLCCCAAAAHSQTAAHTHTHTHKHEYSRRDRETTRAHAFNEANNKLHTAGFALLLRPPRSLSVSLCSYVASLLPSAVKLVLQ